MYNYVIFYNDLICIKINSDLILQSNLLKELNTLF